MSALICGTLAPLARLLVSLFASPEAPRTSDDWIPHTRSPLGARRTRELAHRGAFPGARKVGRVWLIPSAALNAYVEREGSAPLANDNGDEGASDAVRDLAADMGYALAPSAADSRRRSR